MRRSLLLLAGLILALPVSALATPYAGEFLSTGIGARPLGLGGAYVALVDDASASYWNPAALPKSQSRQVQYMHSERFGDLVNYDSGAVVLRARQNANGSRSAIGLSLVMVSVPNILFTTDDPERLREIETGLEGTEFDGNGVLDPGERIDFDALNDSATEVTDRQLAFLLSYGRTQAFMDKLSLGASVKFVRKSIEDFSAWGIGLDLGALYEVNDNWALGMNVQDVSSTFLDWSGTPTEEREYITPTVKIGTAYTRPVEALAGALSFALDFDFRFEEEDQTSFQAGAVTGDVKIGAEYRYRNSLAVRVGSERLGDDTNPFTGGVGFNVGQLSFDYAYRNHSELDDVHRVSGGVRF